MSATEKFSWTKGRGRFYSAGIFFLLIQTLILSALLPYSETRPFIFWVCNNFCFFLALGCFSTNMQFVKGVSYVGLIPQSLWVIDFFSHFLGLNFLTIADYIFTEGYTYANWVSIVVHVLVPAVILTFSFKYHPEIKSLFYALPYIVLVYIGTLFFTPSGEDVNCVFNACRINIYFPYHAALWPLYASILVLLGYAIHHILYYGWRKIRKSRYYPYHV